MAWPAALTTDSDILKYVFEQGISRILEAGNDFSALHQGVAEEIKNWLEANSVGDADRIANTDAFKPAAAQLFAARILGNRNKALSDEYRLEFLRLMRNTRPQLQVGDEPRDGSAARVVVIKQGGTNYTKRRSGAVFRNTRR